MSFFLGVPDLFALDVEAEGVSLVSTFFPNSCCSSSCMRSLSDRTGAALLPTPPLKKKKSKQTKNKTNKQTKNNLKYKKNQILKIVFIFNKTRLRFSFNLLGKINIKKNKTVIIYTCSNTFRDIPLKPFKSPKKSHFAFMKSENCRLCLVFQTRYT